MPADLVCVRIDRRRKPPVIHAVAAALDDDGDRDVAAELAVFEAATRIPSGWTKSRASS